MRSISIVLVAFNIFACNNQPPVIEFEPVIIIEVPPSEEPVPEEPVVDDTDVPVAACEPILRQASIGSEFEWVEVSDDLVIEFEPVLLFANIGGTLQAELQLHTEFDCAPVTVTGLSFAIWTYGAYDDMLCFLEPYASVASLSRTDQTGTSMVAISHGESFYRIVQDVSTNFGGVETWEGFMSVSLLSYLGIEQPFEPFEVQPNSEQELELTLDGLEMFPPGEILALHIYIHYQVDGMNLAGQYVETGVIINSSP